MPISRLTPPNSAREHNDSINQQQKFFSNQNEYLFGNHIIRLSARYEPHKVIGTGAYGVVVSATDLLTKEKVAVKKVANVFDDVVDAKRLLREIKLLRHFEHPNIIALHDVLLPPSMQNFEDVYFVSELMDTDLHRLISSEQELSSDHIRYFIFQLLTALKHIHASGVIHRDIKPQNVLINEDCEIKICDFGLARGRVEEKMTEYVVTRWYRAPEILLACKTYGPAVDVWAVGCIFAELLQRAPLFPGGNYVETTRLICEFLGKEEVNDLSFISTSRALHFVTKEVDYDKPDIPTFASLFNENVVEPDGLNLLKKLLKFNPNHRITVDEALNHQYFNKFNRDSDEEFEEDGPFTFPQENLKLDKPRLQELVFREIAHFDEVARAIIERASEEKRLFFPLHPEEYE